MVWGGFQFGLYRVVAPLSFLSIVSALHHCLLVFLFLADKIFYRLYVNLQAAFSFAVLCIIIFNCSVFLGPYRSFQIRYAAHFLYGLAMIFLRDSLCLSAVSLSPQRHDILDFSYLHVTLANCQRFGF